MPQERQAIQPSKEVIGQHPKSVIILFPDNRTTGDWTQFASEGYIPILAERFRESTSRLLKRYQSQGYRINALVYRDTDEANFSYLYPHDAFANVITWNRNPDDWEDGEGFHELYKESFPEFRDALNPTTGGEIVVGGYHAGDCVINFAKYLRSQGFKAKIDLRLTDQLQFLVVSHELRKMTKGRMLQEMMRDDKRSWEVKKDRHRLT